MQIQINTNHNIEGPGIGRSDQWPNVHEVQKSLPGAVVGQSGVTRFRSNPDGGTRIDVKMSYNPPAGALGHAIAELFGVDPKHEMDDDLMRMKSYLETGVPPHDAAEGRAPRPNGWRPCEVDKDYAANQRRND